MYCPNCATPASAEQKFCRSCGLGLQIHSQVLAGQSPVTEPEQALVGRVEPLKRRRHRLQFWGFITSIGGTAMTLLSGLVYGLVKRLPSMIDPTTVIILGSLMGIGILFILLGVFLVGYSAFLSLPKASAVPLWQQPTALPQAASTTTLPPERRAAVVPSVTEHTTELLETSAAQAQARDTARQGE